MRYTSILAFVALASVAMAKVRCRCSDDGNSINKADTAFACNRGLDYGVESDGYCYVVVKSNAVAVLRYCPNENTSSCQTVA
ncbi:hypothetical protein EMPS_01604 [Entomortierella parvispora]|uniref:Uncharacterized protein n=1 Tax=Entomortierella parvispora TaxID=205924 RepID=A0A9P3H377_9FUNG|nr:hypothetical protein EMPS_01604 [Entomortierella parvispora]